MRKCQFRVLIILLFLSPFSSLFAEVREHFLVGWIGGKSFVIEKGQTFEPSQIGGELGLYQQFFIQIYISKKIGLEVDFGSQRHILKYKELNGRIRKDDSKEGYIFLGLVYKCEEFKKHLIPFLFLGGGFWGEDIYSISAAMRLGSGFKYRLTPIDSPVLLNLNLGLFYMWLDESQELRGSLTLHAGLEMGI